MSQHASGVRWALCWLGAPWLASPAAGAFLYSPIDEAIEAAYFRLDVAELHAAREFAGVQVNKAMLIDPRGAGLGMYDLTDDLFGAPMAGTNITLGAMQTGVFEVEIDPAFFPALETGRIGLWCTITDTDDGWFGIDYMSLFIETESDTHEVFFAGFGNDGFMIAPNPPADNAALSAAFRTLRPHGSSGTGFDEAVSSKSIHVVPGPGVGGLALAAAAGRKRKRR